MPLLKERSIHCIDLGCFNLILISGYPKTVKPLKIMESNFTLLLALTFLVSFKFEKSGYIIKLINNSVEIP